MAPVFKLSLISYASHLDHIIQDETLKSISTLSLLAGPHSLSLLQLCWPVISREQEGAAAPYCLYCRRVKDTLWPSASSQNGFKTEQFTYLVNFLSCGGSACPVPTQRGQEVGALCLQAPALSSTLKTLALLCPMQ